MEKEKLEQLQNNIKSKLFNAFGDTIEQFELLNDYIVPIKIYSFLLSQKIKRN